MSRIKHFEVEQNKILEDIFQFDINDLENLERNKERVSNFDYDIYLKEREEELNKIVSSFTINDWKYEVASDISNIHTLINSGADTDTIAELCEYVFTELGKVDYTTIDYLPEELFQDEKLHKIVVEKYPLHIHKLQNITFDECREAIIKSSHAYSQVIDKFTDMRNYLIWLHLHSGHDFSKIKNWEIHLDSEMVTFIIFESTRIAEYDYELLKQNRNFNLTHQFMLIRKEPTTLPYICFEIGRKFDEMYVKHNDDEETIQDEVRNIVINYKDYFDVLLHPLFENKHVTYTDVYKAYCKLYR